MTIYLRMGPLMSPPIEVPDGTTEWRLRVPCRLPMWNDRGQPVAERIERQAVFMRTDKHTGAVDANGITPIFDYVG